MRALPVIAAGLLLSACLAPEEPVPIDQLPFDPTYQGVETQLLDGDLVRFLVTMTGARAPQDVIDYAECAAAQYTLIRGYGFARHLRTNVDEEDGIWTADAVYTISASLPEGLKTLDAEIVVANCAERNIPMV
ncbi:hypothetical protein [Pseudaestuariivita sp.]|uniref:hypothetical protein n=1 Tax=Pseudaestuariivita sp. TaxID=2211669 RepID=UPI004058EBC8